MIVECPKCGFSQPKDAYCAKCGVNMSSFQSAPLPLVTRLFANPVLHITVISFLVVAGTLYIIRHQKKQEIARRMEYLRGGPVYTDATGSSGPTTTTASDTEAQSNNTTSSQVPPPPPPPQAAANTTTGSGQQPVQPSGQPPTAASFINGQRGMATVASAAGEGNERSKSNPAKELKLKVHYLLVSKSNLNRFLIEAQNNPGFIDFGEARMGTLRSATALLNASDSLEIVEKTVEVEGPEVIWNVGGPVSEYQPGITSKINVVSKDSLALRGEFEMLKAFYDGRDRSGNPALKAFGPVQFEMAPKAALLLSMVLPAVEQSSTPTANGFLRIFRMTDFLQGQSEFVILVEFD